MLGKLGQVDLLSLLVHVLLAEVMQEGGQDDIVIDRAAEAVVVEDTWYSEVNGGKAPVTVHVDGDKHNVEGEDVHLLGPLLDCGVTTCVKVCEEVCGHAVHLGIMVQDIDDAATALGNHGQKHLNDLVIEPVVSSQGEEVMLGDVNVVPAQDDFTDTEHGTGASSG